MKSKFVEAEACRWAVLFAAELGLQNVQSQVVIKLIQDQVPCLAADGLILEEAHVSARD